MSVRYRSRFNRNPLALALAGALLLPAGSALAQSNEAAPPQQSEQTAEDESKTLDKIVVTGSRISKDTFNSVSPVQVINREESTVAGFNSTSGVLQSTAVTGGSEQINNAYGGFVVNGGPGVNTLSLRGLGATRTLLLLNGRRVSPAGSRGAVGSADLNVLPNIMIDHIEVLKDGASSIYGSDAVAGVVNIITRPKVDGVTVEVQQNSTQHGGANETRFSGMGGTTGDNWRVSGSFEVFKRSAMRIGQRDWASDCPLPLFGRNPDGSYGANDYIDPTTGKPKCWTLDNGGVTINTLGTAARPGIDADTGLPGTFNRWRPDASVTSGFAGFEGVSFYSRDSFAPEMLDEHLISPTTNMTGFLQGGVDLNAMGNAELYFELLAHRRNSNQDGYLQHSVDYARNSPLLGQYSFLNDNPVNAGSNADGSTNGLPYVARAFVGWGIYKNEQEVDFYRATTGLRGDLTSEWGYDFYISHANSSSDYRTQNRLTDRIAASYRVAPDGNGGFMCADADRRAEGCVAAPVLSASVIGGNLSQEYRDYIMQWTRGNTKYTESTFNLGVNGPLFDLPFGTAYGAFGVEYRTAEIDDTPDPNSISSNLYGFTSSTPTRGKDNVTEAYAEFEFPLLSGLKGAEELSINLSGRYTDYKSYGEDTTYKLGLLYTPVNWLSIRASHGTSYRAPALFEQHLGATSGFAAAGTDPCSEYGNSNDTNTNSYKNCQSLGLPTDFLQTNSVAVFTKGGAETGLASETSEATTAGIVLQPEFPAWFGDLSFAADYYSINVENGVGRPSGAQVLNLCYDSDPAEFTANLGYCSLIQRAANNALTVTTGYLNVAAQVARGWDFTARYTRDVGPGTFRANVAVTHYLEQGSQTFPDQPYRNFNGRMGSPDYTGQLDLSYSLRGWQMRYGVDWVGAVSDYDYYMDNFGDDYRPDYQMSIDDYFLHTVSARYSGDKWSVTAGIRNVADKDPPSGISAAAGNVIGNSLLSSSYDYLGRTFFLNYSKSF